MSFYNHMSDTEKEQFHTMAKEIAVMKRWLPIFMAFGAIIGFSVKGTLWFEGNVAKKSDTEAIRTEIKDLRKDISGVVDFTQSAANVHTHLNNRIDSLSKIVSNKYRFVAERKDENGNIQTYPIN